MTHRHLVLLVDDDRGALGVLGEILTDDGYEVLTATGGGQALEIATGVVPCMAIIDVMMPAMDGYELCRRIKSLPGFGQVPVVMATASVDVDHVAKSRASGAVDHLSKPFNVSEVRMRVATHTRLHDALRFQRRSEERFEAISAAVQDAIVIIDHDGTVAHWNPSAESMFGYAVAAAVGRPVHELIMPAGMYPQQPDAFRAFQETGQGGAVGNTVELCAQRRDGSQFPVEMSLSPVVLDAQPHVIGIVRDVTERHRAEGLSRVLFNSSYDAIVTMAAPNWNFSSANPAALKMFGAANIEEFTTQGPWDYSPSTQPDGTPSNEQAAKMISRAVRQGSQSFEWSHVRGDGTPFDAAVLMTRVPGDGEPVLQATVRDITEHKAKERELRRLAMAVEQTPDTIVITDVNGCIQYVNPSFEKVFGYSRQEAIGENPRILKSGAHSREFYQEMWATLGRGEVWSGQLTNRTKQGDRVIEDVTISPVLDLAGKVVNYVAVKKDVTDELAMEAQLRQSQKLEAVGQLAAGIAHEINTPTQFVGDSVHFLKRGFDDLLQLVASYQKAFVGLQAGDSMEDLVQELQEAEEDADLDYLKEQAPKAFERTFDGIGRVAQIVGAMKDFAHPDAEDKQPADLNEAIKSTATMSRNEYKYVAELELELGELPAVSCHIGELNQVLLNLIVNSAHAIADVVGDSGERGKIVVQTRTDGAEVVVTVRDTGAGMPPEVQEHIFDPFFTTKEVGKGTGQGLAIARAVVVDKHGGSIRCDSQPGAGTTFTLRLPASG